MIGKDKKLYRKGLVSIKKIKTERYLIPDRFSRKQVLSGDKTYPATGLARRQDLPGNGARPATRLARKQDPSGNKIHPTIQKLQANQSAGIASYQEIADFQQTLYQGCVLWKIEICI